MHAKCLAQCIRSYTCQLYVVWINHISIFPEYKEMHLVEASVSCNLLCMPKIIIWMW